MFGPFVLFTVLAFTGDSRTDYCYRGASVSTETFTVTGQSGWAARSVEAHLNPVAGAAGSMGIVLHYQDSSNFYLFIYSTASSALRIFRRTGGNYIQLASTPLLIPFGEEHTMRAETDGNGNLSLYWDDVLRASAFDATFSAGRIGLRVITMTATFDDVVARDAQGGVLLTDDFDDGNADGWSAGSGWSVIVEGGGSMPQPDFDTNFEGGNIQVTLVDPQNWTVHVTPQLKGTSPYRAWFYFRMSNLSPEQPTNLIFENIDFFTRPYYSYDNLNWIEFSAPSGNVYSTIFTEDSVWIAHSIPYLTNHEQALIDDVHGPYVQTSVLTMSEGGHPVHRLTITAPNGLPNKYGIWFVARQHAWEASGSWVADGLARWLVSSDPQAVELRAKAVLNLVPIMDIDNVMLGGSGKDQQPIDFNRDWRSAPFWNAVREVIGAIDSVAAAESYDLFFDSHCPGIESTFLYVQPVSMVPPPYWTRFADFLQILIANAGSSSIPYGGGYRELGPEYHPLWDQISLWHQYTTHSELRLSLSLETQAAPVAGYLSWAESIGRTFDEFLPARTTDVDLAGDVPASGIALMGLRPNPFRAATAMSIYLPEAARARLTVHDALGRRVRTLVEELRPAGSSAATWDGRNDSGNPVAGGIYFLRLDTPDLDPPDRSVTDKVTLIR